MAHELITSFDDFTVETISYGAPRTNARGGKSIKILDTRKNTLILSTPLILTWGVNKMIDEDTGRVSYNMSLQFPSSDYANEATMEFFEKMKNFESKILDDCVKNCKDWFGKPKMSREVAEALFTPILKYPNNKVTGEPDYSRSPSLRIKIPYWEGKFNTELYNTDHEVIYNSETDLTNKSFETFIPKASHVVAAIQCNGLWFAGGKFGVTWQLTQAIVRTPARVQGKCFLSLSTTDHSELDKVAQREAEVHLNDDIEEELHTHSETVVDATNVEDSDEEHDTQDEPEVKVEEEKPKRKVVKKKVAKKSD